VKVFVSWSRSSSRAVAEEFARWLPRVIQECDPFISSDTEKGDRWFDTIESNLAEARVGVLFLTPENKEAPWLNYEAGALRTLQSGNMKRLCAVFVGMKTADYDGPIKNFQMTDFSDKADMLKLMKSINGAADRPLEGAMLEQEFEEKWGRLVDSTASAVAASRYNSPKPRSAPARRSQDDKLDEVLDLLRELRFARSSDRVKELQDEGRFDRRSTLSEKELKASARRESANWLGKYLITPNGENEGKVVEVQNLGEGRVRVSTETGYAQTSSEILVQVTEAPF
jgi:hypothetical protein